MWWRAGVVHRLFAGPTISNDRVASWRTSYKCVRKRLNLGIAAVLAAAQGADRGAGAGRPSAFRPGPPHNVFAFAHSAPLLVPYGTGSGVMPSRKPSIPAKAVVLVSTGKPGLRANRTAL